MIRKSFFEHTIELQQRAHAPQLACWSVADLSANAVWWKSRLRGCGVSERILKKQNSLQPKIPCKLVKAKRRSRFGGAAGSFNSLSKIKKQDGHMKELSYGLQK
jgi:hypothetical protein